MQNKPRNKSTRLAEGITNSMATWTFVLSFLLFCVAWMIWNTKMPKSLQFDMFPFIFLNLMLSLIAAVQGSVIMISQKYQDKKRDETMHRIDKNTEAVLKLEKKLEKLVKENHA